MEYAVKATTAKKNILEQIIIINGGMDDDVKNHEPKMIKDKNGQLRRSK